jgi:hypothetical protein
VTPRSRASIDRREGRLRKESACEGTLASTSRPALVVVARSRDGSVSANEPMAARTAAFGGRDGGEPGLAKAGGLDPPAETILERPRSMVADAGS